MSRSGLVPRPLDPESSALTVRPLSLISKIVTLVEIISHEYPSPGIELRLKSLHLHCFRKQADIMLVNCAQV